jgi:hypothetical protein
LCKQSLKLERTQEAYMVCAIAACKLKNPEAKSYISKLASPQRAGMARQVCLSNGVKVSPRAPKKAVDPPKTVPADEVKDELPDRADMTVRELTSQAKAAVKAQQLGKGLRICEQALAKKPGDQEAVMVCAIAACKLKQATKAKRYIGRLRSSQRSSMARQICLTNNIVVKKSP